MNFIKRNFARVRIFLTVLLVGANILWCATRILEAKAQPTATITKGEVILENTCVRYVLSTEKGLQLKEIFNNETADNYIKHPALSALFVITTGAWKLDSTKFDVVDIKKQEDGESVSISLSLFHQPASILVNLKVIMDNSPETKWSLKVTNKDNKEMELKVCFPALGGVQIGDKIGDNYYLYPHEGGWINHLPVDLKMGWAHAQIQIIDLYNPRSGGGIYIRSNDNKAIYYKTFEFKKKVDLNKAPFRHCAADDDTATEIFNFDVGIGMGIHYLKEKLPPGSSFVLPESVIGIHNGDWREAMQRYKEWVLTWYKPNKRPEWWRKCFVWDHATDSPYRNGKYDFLTPVIERNKDPNALDRIDWISIVNWWQPPYGAEGCGDYAYYQEMGGLESFREAVKAAHDKGISINLYMEGWLVGLSSKVGKTYGEAWGIMNKNGEYSRAYGVWNMCPSIPEWQDYLANTVARLVKDTDADAVYLDSIGMQNSLCYHPQHKHKPGDWFKGVGEMFRKVHEAVDKVKSDVVIWSEDFSCDINTQYMDSSLSYAVQGGQYFRKQGIDLNPTGISLFRFYFPDFKLFEWPLEVWDLPGFRQAFFNGNGVMGTLVDTYNKSEKRRLLGIVRVLRNNRDAFSALNPVPLIETKREGIYANKFPTNEKIIYTMYNATKESQGRELLSVKHKEGYHFVELFSHKGVETKLRGEDVSLSFEVPSEEVICIAQLPKVLEVKEEMQGLKISIAKEYPALALKIGIIDKKGEWLTKEINIDKQGIFLSPEEIFGENYSYRSITVQLLSDSSLLDEVTVGTNKIILLDDELPSGTIPEGIWQWDESVKYSGEKSHTEPQTQGSTKHSLIGVKQVIPFGSSIVQYIYLDSQNIPKQIMIEFKTKEMGWQHSVYWGDNFLVPSWAGYGTPRLYPMGNILPTGKWERLKISSSAIGIEGLELEGIRFSLYGGKANWDKTTIIMAEWDDD